MCARFLQAVKEYYLEVKSGIIFGMKWDKYFHLWKEKEWCYFKQRQNIDSVIFNTIRNNGSCCVLELDIHEFSNLQITISWETPDIFRIGYKTNYIFLQLRTPPFKHGIQLQM